MTDIAIVDYGMGNLRSVCKALEHVAPNASIIVTSDPRTVRRATRVVVPGQGAMPDCLHELDAHGLREVVVEAATHKPFLGICLGLQMLFDKSEEGNVEGLGLVSGQVRRFPGAEPPMTGTGGDRNTDAENPARERLKVPHMGWNQVHQTATHPLWKGIPQDTRFYFVHSYYAEPSTPESQTAYSLYPFPFTCAIARDNIFAVQFHPEKSHDAGLTLLSNFLRWEPV